MTKCDIIKDLLPLYVDQVCSEDSIKLIEEHLETCEDCKNTLELYSKELNKKAYEEKAAFRNFAKKMKTKTCKKTIITAVGAILATLLISVLVYVPEFQIAWTDNLAVVEIPVDEGYNIYITARNYKNAYATYVMNDDGSCDIYITATQNVLTKLFAGRDEGDRFIRIGNNVCVSYKNSGNTLQFMLPNGTDINAIYYIDISPKELVLMTSEDVNTNEEKATLIYSNQ